MASLSQISPLRPVFLVLTTVKNVLFLLSLNASNVRLLSIWIQRKLIGEFSAKGVPIIVKNAF